MRRICVYLNSEERIVIYKEGGCQFERNLGKGFGWIVDNDACRDWKAALTEAQAVINRVMSNLELVS